MSRFARFRFAGAALVVAAVAYATPVMGQSTDTPKLLPGESVIRVTAEGSVERMPDRLGMSVTIQSDGSSPSDVAKVNAARLRQLMADLRTIGIPEAWIGAEDFEATPIYEERSDGRDDRSKVIGYRSRQQVSIELRELNRFQAVLDRLAREGHSNLSASFGLSSRDEAQKAAQREAIASARAEADNIASALGKKVARLLLVSNDKAGYQGWKDLGDTIIVTGSRVQPIELKPAPVKVESTVYVDWSLVDR